MTSFTVPPHTVTGVVQEVLPGFGLAYVADIEGRTWAVTRAAVGARLDKLQQGQRLALAIVGHDNFEVVTGFTALD